MEKKGVEKFERINIKKPNVFNSLNANVYYRFKIKLTVNSAQQIFQVNASIETVDIKFGNLFAHWCLV